MPEFGLEEETPIMNSKAVGLNSEQVYISGAYTYMPITKSLDHKLLRGSSYNLIANVFHLKEETELLSSTVMLHFSIHIQQVMTIKELILFRFQTGHIKKLLM